MSTTVLKTLTVGSLYACGSYATRKHTPTRESFDEAVHALTPPPYYLRFRPGEVCLHYHTLCCHILLHPLQFADWACHTDTVVALRRGVRQAEWWRERAGDVAFLLRVLYHFFFAPRKTAEDYAAKTGRIERWKTVPPPPPGTVRVRWYPDVKAPLLPRGLHHNLYTDLPLGPRGELDVRPLKRMWGMQNCYVLDCNRARPTLTQHQRGEKLSAMDVKVLLGYHECLGVVELPTEAMTRARALRKKLPASPRELFHSLALLSALPLLAVMLVLIWQTATLKKSGALDVPALVVAGVRAGPSALAHAAISALALVPWLAWGMAKACVRTGAAVFGPLVGRTPPPRDVLAHIFAWLWAIVRVVCELLREEFRNFVHSAMTGA